MKEEDLQITFGLFAFSSFCGYIVGQESAFLVVAKSFRFGNSGKMSDFTFRLLSRSTSSSEDIVSSEPSSLSKEAFDKFATSTVVPTKGPLVALLLLCVRGVRLCSLPVQPFLRFLCGSGSESGSESGLEDFKQCSESARLRTSPLSNLIAFVGIWLCEIVQQGSYLSSRTAFVPFLDVSLEVNRSMRVTEGIDSGIEDDAKIIGDDGIV